MTKKLCIDCTHYVKPTFWEKLVYSDFADTCKHPEAISFVRGLPTPCMTARIAVCSDGALYEPHKGDKK